MSDFMCFFQFDNLYNLFPAQQTPEKLNTSSMSLLNSFNMTWLVLSCPHWPNQVSTPNSLQERAPSRQGTLVVWIQYIRRVGHVGLLRSPGSLATKRRRERRWRRWKRRKVSSLMMRCGHFVEQSIQMLDLHEKRQTLVMMGPASTIRAARKVYSLQTYTCLDHMAISCWPCYAVTCWDCHS